MGGEEKEEWVRERDGRGGKDRRGGEEEGRELCPPPGKLFSPWSLGV